MFVLLHEQEPLHRLVARLQEVGIADGLEQVIQRVDAEPVNGILVEGGGEHDARVLGNHLAQLQSVQLGHLYVEEQQVHRRLADTVQGVGSIGVLAAQFQEWYLLHIAREQFHCQRFVVNDGTLDNHDCSSFLMVILE